MKIGNKIPDWLFRTLRLLYDIKELIVMKLFWRRRLRFIDRGVYELVKIVNTWKLAKGTFMSCAGHGDAYFPYISIYFKTKEAAEAFVIEMAKQYSTSLWIGQPHRDGDPYRVQAGIEDFRMPPRERMNKLAETITNAINSVVLPEEEV